jgi:enoyl-CoA hydratase/carnithine racemase
VRVLDLGDGENRFQPAWVDAVNELLDQVETVGSPCALVTCATGKIWSNGLDLDWFAVNPDDAETFLALVHQLFARVLVLPVATVAAITGHAFAAGAMLATAHDFKVMRADRGYWCCPEVDLGLPFTPGMDALLRACLPIRAAHEPMTTGRRYSGRMRLRRASWTR